MRPAHAVALLGTVGLLSGTAWLAEADGAGRDPVVSSTRQVPLPVVVAPREVEVSRSAASPRGAGGDRADPGWVRSTAVLAGIPEPAVAAYASAALAAPPDCELGWTTLAGIGWVESQHGTLGGRTLGADGRSSTPVLGPALDGAVFAAVPATPEGTELHGDPEWDHAMGPMQFISQTWALWARDGDDDGLADPFDLDDAVAAAAAYLCAGGDGLDTGTAWAAAVFSYNHSDAYVADVHHAATTYAERVG